MSECGLVPALLNMIRAPVGAAEAPSSSRAFPWGYQARRTYIMAYAVAILETVIMSTPVAVKTFRDINAPAVVVQRLYGEVAALRKDS